MISTFLKVIRRLQAERREWLRWTAYGEPVRVHYGMETLPSPEDPISGGIVKCLDLASRFPSQSSRTNLLHLVSSALPDRRELMTRAAQRAGGRVVLNQNGVAYPAWAGPDAARLNRPNAHVHARADYVIYQSDFCRRCAIRFLGAANGPSEILYNPVDTDLFVPSGDADDHVHHAGPTLLVAGSHHDASRIRLAIEGLRYVRHSGLEARLLIAGRLLWNEQAEAEARSWVTQAALNDHVEWVGPYTQSHAPALFRKAHVLVHVKPQDPCPRLVVEAMACGLPVIHRQSGGTPELVGPDAGVGLPDMEDFERYAPLDSKDVASAILKAWSMYPALSQAARQRAVSHFAVKPWLDAHERIFRSL